jgi:hypothetical protein
LSIPSGQYVDKNRIISSDDIIFVVAMLRAICLSVSKLNLLSILGKNFITDCSI